MSAPGSRTYRLEPLDSSGVFLGLSAVQCVLLGAGIVVSVTSLTAGVPLGVAAAPTLAAAAASFARLHGQAVWEWLPVAAVWVARGVRGRRRWAAPLELWPSASESTALPPCLAGLSIVEVAWRGGGVIGAVNDGRNHTLTAVVPVAGPQFVVESRAEQERLLAGWGDVLGQYAVERGVVAHVAWSDFAQPSGLVDHHAWVRAEGRGDTNPSAVESYGQLLDIATASAIHHDCVVTITVARDRLSRRTAPPGDDEPSGAEPPRDDRSGAGPAGTATAGRPGDLRRGSAREGRLERALVASVESLLRGLRSAGLSAGDPLDGAAIQRMLRTRVDPSAVRSRPCRGRLVDRLASVSTATAGPMAMATQWRHIRVDSSWHRSWWIGSWPRMAVPPSWLEPFLSAGGVTRSMTVYFQPVSTFQSRRRIERDLVKLDSDAVTREAKGRRVDARHRRATDALLGREAELVAGFVEMGYVGVVTVSAGSLAELEDHAEIVEQLAREHGMDLRALDARHDVGWAAGLPLGLAPRSGVMW